MFCVAHGCDKPIVYNSGYCNSHYQRLNLYGRLETVIWGQSTHPLYDVWNERKNDGTLCNEWLDFKTFINDVGERPFNHRLTKINKKELYSKTNFKWLKYFPKLDGETDKEQLIRRRKEAPEIYKNYELKSHFNITYEQYLVLLKKQNFVCAICKQKEKTKHHVTGEFKSLAVDHCHKTNKIRGLLCQRCNRVLGKINDSVDLLDTMKAYLNAHDS